VLIINVTNVVTITPTFKGIRVGFNVNLSDGEVSALHLTWRFTVLVIPPVSRRGVSVIARMRVPSVITSLKMAGPANDTRGRPKKVTQVPLSSFLSLHIRVDLCTKGSARYLTPSGVAAGVQDCWVTSQ
jgi:hypothetical protein